MENELSCGGATTDSADEEYAEKFYSPTSIPNSFKNHWLLNQKQHDDEHSKTDNSDIEFSEKEDFIDNTGLRHEDHNSASAAMENLEQFQSTIHCYLNQVKNKRSNRKLFWCPDNDDDVANCSGNGTDDELISVSGIDFRQIVNEELGNNAGKKSADDDLKFMTVKTHQSSTTTKTNKIKRNFNKIEKIPRNLFVPSEDSTDESDLDVSMKDYYKIRHQNQMKLKVDILNIEPKILSNKKTNDLETSEEEEEQEENGDILHGDPHKKLLK